MGDLLLYPTNYLIKTPLNVEHTLLHTQGNLRKLHH